MQEATKLPRSKYDPKDETILQQAKHQYGEVLEPEDSETPPDYSDGRKRKEPSEFDSTAKVGEIVLIFPHPSGEMKKYEYYSGTASLFKEVSKNCFIIKTAAQNLVRVDRNELGIPSIREHVEGYMFL